MDKKTVAVIALILVVFAGLVSYYNIIKPSDDPNAIEKYDSSKIVVVDEGEIQEHVRGKEDSKIVVVEYADLECPGCASMMLKASELHKKYGDRVAFVFRNYPLSMHQNARAAAAAAESAGMQGYYWEMIEALYANRNDWIGETGASRTKAFEKIFETVAPDGDMTAFGVGMTDERVKRKVDFDFELGKKRDHVTQTPAFYVNGKAITVEEADTLDSVKDKIEKEIKSLLKE